MGSGSARAGLGKVQTFQKVMLAILFISALATAIGTGFDRFGEATQVRVAITVRGSDVMHARPVVVSPADDAGDVVATGTLAPRDVQVVLRLRPGTYLVSIAAPALCVQQLKVSKKALQVPVVECP